MMRRQGTGPDFKRALDDHLEAARSAERTGAWVQAREEYEAALGSLHHSGDPALAGPLLRWIGRTHLNAGALQEAEDCFEAALAVAELAGDRETLSNTVNCIAIVQQQRGKLDEAEGLYNQARLWAESGSDQKLLAMIDQNLGTIASIRGHPAMAIGHYRKSLEGYRDLGLSDYVAPLLSNMAMLLGKMGDFAEAEELYREAFTAAEDRGDVNTQVAIQVNRAALWIDSGDHGEARAACEAAYGPAERLGVPRWLGEIHKILGVIHREAGELDRAEENLGKAEDFARETEDTLLVAEILKELAEVFWLGGRHRDTLGCLNRAHGLFSDLKARHDLADLAEKQARLEELFQEIVVRWGESIESSDLYTHGHCERVAQFGCALAEAVGMASEDLTWFKMGAFLHDLGKVLLPPDILNKPGPLTGEERAVMETHPAQGERLLEQIDFPWDIRPMVRHHHEHWAGTGYPDGLSGTDIPLSARVLTIADVFDALTTERSYRPAFSLEKALEIMEEDSGRIFDPYLFSIFCQLVVGEGPTDGGGGDHPSIAAPSPDQGPWAPGHISWTPRPRRQREPTGSSEYPDGLFGHKPDRLSEMN